MRGVPPWAAGLDLVGLVAVGVELDLCGGHGTGEQLEAAHPPLEEPANIQCVVKNSGCVKGDSLVQLGISTLVGKGDLCNRV